MRLQVKVVPGSSRDEIAGWLGDVLKVRVTAPPERGRANAAVCIVVAAALGVSAGDVALLSGHASPRKTLDIRGLSESDVRLRLAKPGR